ncbi:HD domain-containing protein [Paenibacillus septentrionalis]|uniref:HD domain-containing protein n=1 Tax=Paenibacillus septentrionalis TaxID=429342 RepID=A0ABW1V8N7_9BACL
MAFLREEKVFKDPVHSYIYVQDELIWNLINSSEFQRLRRIRQLGTTFLTFHGAEHSRFSHSLGVYEITRRIISQFERNHYPDWPKEERMVALCAALLHDIGHAPFSHSIEEIFETDHEQWTINILLGDTEINRILSSNSSSLPRQVAEVIQKTYSKSIVVSLISSQLDADRMDYLLRDAYFTGTDYGNFDLERILRVLRPHDGTIVVKESGMHAIEHYLMSRYQMYWQVYFHPVTRSSEIILRQIFKRAKQLHEQGYSFTWVDPSILALIEGRITLQSYLSLDESLVQYAFSCWQHEQDALLAELCQRFLNRRLYKYITFEELSEEYLTEIEEAFTAIGLHPEFHMEIDYPFDRPYDVYRSEKTSSSREKAPIMLLEKDGSLSEIATKSDIVSSISGLHQGRYHLYYPEEALIRHRHLLSDTIKQIFNIHDEEQRTNG